MINRLKAAVSITVLMLTPLSVLATADDGRSWEFSVLLDGSKIGVHRFELMQSGSGQEVRSEARFDVRFLFIPAFRYRHSNREVWADGCLSRIESRTRQNGKQLAVSGTRVDDEFRVDTGEGKDVLGTCVKTFAYWNPDFLDESRLLNPQTGEYLPVRVDELGKQRIVVRGEPVTAAAYRVVAKEIELTVWYSEDEEWLGLESVARGGRILRYELT